MAQINSKSRAFGLILGIAIGSALGVATDNIGVARKPVIGRSVN